MRSTDATALDRLSDPELRRTVAHEQDPDRLVALATCLPEAVLDHEQRAYVAVLSRGRQALLMDLLLDRVAGLPDASREAILSSVGQAVDGYWCAFSPFTDVLAKHLDAPGLGGLVLPRLQRAIFCADLLTSLRAAGVAGPAEWLAEIRRRRATQDFVEQAWDLPSTLQRLDELLATPATDA